MLIFGLVFSRGIRANNSKSQKFRKWFWKKGLFYIIGNGEEVCEGHGYAQITCESISCCQWDNGQCWSAVGQDPCSNNTHITTTLYSTTTTVNTIAGIE